MSVLHPAVESRFQMLDSLVGLPRPGCSCLGSMVLFVHAPGISLDFLHMQQKERCFTHGCLPSLFLRVDT